MKSCIFLILLVLFLFLPNQAKAGLFDMSNAGGGNNPEDEIQQTNQTNEIPIYDKVDKMIQRRLKEAGKLIEEGKELIRRGEKKKNQNLVIKGQIKKEIGEKQLEILKEQEENKKKQRENDIW